MVPEWRGTVSTGFEKVAERFQDSLEATPRNGAALSVYVEGECVIDLVGGTADGRTGAPWTHKTLSTIFSTTKGLTSVLVARLVQEERLDYGAPVASYWPEFAQAGKADVTVRELLAHQAGLAAPRETFVLNDILEWDTVVAGLAQQEPLWLPGTGHSYHTITFGWLVGELVRRVTGVSVGEYFRELVTDPLGAEAWIGLPAEQQHRVTHLAWADGPAPSSDPMQTEEDRYWQDRATTLGAALPAKLFTETAGFNDPRLRAAEIPGAGGIATARALAAIWSATVVETNGLRLLDDATIRRATAVQSVGRPVWGGLPPWSIWGMGFHVYAPPLHSYLGPTSFGHDGAGGQLGFADLDRRVGVAYLTNLLQEGEDSRGRSIVEALDYALRDAPLSRR